MKASGFGGTHLVERVIWCPLKQRDTAVTFQAKGHVFKKYLSVVDCAARHDAGPVCDQRCVRMATSSPPRWRVVGDGGRPRAF